MTALDGEMQRLHPVLQGQILRLELVGGRNKRRREKVRRLAFFNTTREAVHSDQIRGEKSVSRESRGKLIMIQVIDQHRINGQNVKRL